MSVVGYYMMALGYYISVLYKGYYVRVLMYKGIILLY